MIVDYETMLLALYTDEDSMRKLIDGGLKDENIGIIGDDALATWKTAKDWFQHKGKAVPLEILLHDHEQYVKTKRSEEEVEVDPLWLIKTLQTRYLRETYRKRFTEAQEDGTFKGEMEPEETLRRTKELTRDLLRITVNSTAERPLEPMSVDLSEFIEDTISYEERVKDGRAIAPVTFGFSHVDQLYVGLRTGEVAVMAAYTKIGKSFLLCKQALAAAQAGRRVALWTLENSKEETYARLTALAAPLPYDHITNKNVWPQEWQAFRDLVGQEVFDLIHVKHPEGRDSSSLEEMYWQSHDVGAELLVGDQLSHVYFPTPKGGSDWLNEGEKVLAARRLSGETNMASIWAAQLNVKAAKKDDLDSTMMARSQGIVQGSDFVFYVSDPTRGLGNIRKLSCSTSRRGPRAEWQMVFDFSPLAIETTGII